MCLGIEMGDTLTQLAIPGSPQPPSQNHLLHCSIAQYKVIFFTVLILIMHDHHHCLQWCYVGSWPCRPSCDGGRGPRLACLCSQVVTGCSQVVSSSSQVVTNCCQAVTDCSQAVTKW